MLSCTDFFSSVSTHTFLYMLTICSPNSRLKSRVCGSLLIIRQDVVNTAWLLVNDVAEHVDQGFRTAYLRAFQENNLSYGFL